MFCLKCFLDFVDLRTKRRAFDIVMAVRRLQEKEILVMEMNHHWKSLSTPGDSVKELSCLVSRATVQSMYSKCYIERMYISVTDDKVTNTGFIYIFIIHLRFTVGPKWRRVERSAEHHPKKAARHQRHDGYCEIQLPASFDWSRDHQLLAQCFRWLFWQWL